MGLALFAFLAVFLLIGSAGFLLLNRVGMSQRLSAVVQPQQESWLRKFKWKGASGSIGAAVKPAKHLDRQSRHARTGEKKSDHDLVE